NIKIDNFRCVRSANIYPTQHNVLLGPNNTGKTTILEAINMVLNPELTFRTNVIDENDFYNRHYLIEDISEIKQDSISNELENNGDVDVSESQTEENNEENPEIYIEITLSDFSTEDEDQFNDKLVVWDPENNIIIESTQEGEEPLKNAQTAIRVCFSAWYDQDEDDFDHSTYFLNHNELERENCPRFGKEDKWKAVNVWLQ
ncbi:AAA family ATPase, partial [candidate division KSB1 bacterium]|nr:AAA family ATPase [candidate division KSB1 bacterium]